MGKSGSKKSAGGRLKWQTASKDTEAEVTLNDFANASASKGRLTKAATTHLQREVHLLCRKNDSDLAWYEKDLEDFNLDLISDNESDEEDSSRQHSKSRKSRKCNAQANDKGQSYPVDVWYLLAEYISPEDVACFAGICRSSSYVVSRPKFWCRLYKRYYNNGITLPPSLKPDCIERPRGLKACVVRALFLMYPPFSERLCGMVPFNNNPHQLGRARCILTWHQKQESNLYHFYFKFHVWGEERTSTIQKRKKLKCWFERTRPDLLEMLEDVAANSELGCRILQVSCLSYVPMPEILGLYLSSVQLNVSQDMIHHRIKLTFSCTSYQAMKRETNEAMVILEPVVSCRTLDWWHPQYPLPSS